MAWQDMVFLVGNLVLGAVLIPTLLDENVEIPLKTSIPTGLVLLIFAASYFTLELYFSAVSTAVIAAMWFYIAGFRNSSSGKEKLVSF